MHIILLWNKTLYVTLYVCTYVYNIYIYIKISYLYVHNWFISCNKYLHIKILEKVNNGRFIMNMIIFYQCSKKHFCIYNKSDVDCVISRACMRRVSACATFPFKCLSFTWVSKRAFVNQWSVPHHGWSIKVGCRSARFFRCSDGSWPFTISWQDRTSWNID